MSAMRQGYGACSGLRVMHAVALLCVLAVTAAIPGVRTAWGDSEDEKLARQIELRLAAQSLQAMLDYATRLKRVSEPIRLHGAPLCDEKLALPAVSSSRIETSCPGRCTTLHRIVSTWISEFASCGSCRSFPRTWRGFRSGM